MDTNSLRLTLEALRAEGASVGVIVDELKHNLSAAEMRLTHVRSAIENLEALLGDTRVSKTEAPAAVQPPVEAERPTERYEDADTSRKRVPSTDWVAEVVNSLGRVASRDEIFEAFKEQKGIPDTWVNPRNSFGNALTRAADRGMIQRLDGDRFAPSGYTGAQASLDLGGR